MRTIRLARPLVINLTGFDPEATTLNAGVNVVPEHVVTWLAENPTPGAVVLDAEEAAAVAAAAPQPATPEAAPPAGEGTPPAPAEDLSALTATELRARAVEAGIAGASGMRKAALVAALTADGGE